jgi:L-fuconolactonase
MVITDAQVHVWVEKNGAPNAYVEPHLVPQLTPQQLIIELDAAGVDRAVLIPPSWNGEGNGVAIKAAQDHPDRFGAMGRIDLEKPVDLTRWMDDPGVLGIRVVLNPSFDETSAEWFWPMATKADIPVMIAAPSRTPLIGALARRYPDLRLIVDHLNLGHTSPSEIEGRIDELLLIAKFPNIAVKISALPQIMKEEAPFPSLGPILGRVIEAFGPDRCMWGSDLAGLTCPYTEWVQAFTDSDYLSETEKALLLNGTISNWLNWQVI